MHTSSFHHKYKHGDKVVYKYDFSDEPYIINNIICKSFREKDEVKYIIKYDLIRGKSFKYGISEGCLRYYDIDDKQDTRNPIEKLWDDYEMSKELDLLFNSFENCDYDGEYLKKAEEQFLQLNSMKGEV